MREGRGGWEEPRVNTGTELKAFGLSLFHTVIKKKVFSEKRLYVCQQKTFNLSCASVFTHINLYKPETGLNAHHSFCLFS